MAQEWAMKLYKSREWRDLRQAIIQERGLRCERCGRLVRDASELTADHIRELTPETVQDADVALNQDNVQLLCADCHNRKHQRFGHASRGVFIVYGSPCSGKTTLVNQLKLRGDIIVDMDLLYQQSVAAYSTTSRITSSRWCSDYATRHLMQYAHGWGIGIMRTSSAAIRTKLSERRWPGSSARSFCTASRRGRSAWHAPRSAASFHLSGSSMYASGGMIMSLEYSRRAGPPGLENFSDGNRTVRDTFLWSVPKF